VPDVQLLQAVERSEGFEIWSVPVDHLERQEVREVSDGVPDLVLAREHARVGDAARVRKRRKVLAAIAPDVHLSGHGTRLFANAPTCRGELAQTYLVLAPPGMSDRLLH
jgi:hypothetical protein